MRAPVCPGRARQARGVSRNQSARRGDRRRAQGADREERKRSPRADRVGGAFAILLAGPSRAAGPLRGRSVSERDPVPLVPIRPRKAMSSPNEVRIVETLEEMAGLAPSWKGLLAESRSDAIFLTWEWLYTWSECFLGSEGRPFVLTVFHHGDLVGIAPWCIRARRRAGIGVRRIEFLGGPEGG